jgi:hypothetical protein
MAGSSTFLNTLLMLKKYSAQLVMFWQTFGRLSKIAFTPDSQLLWNLDYPSAIQGG